MKTITLSPRKNLNGLGYGKKQYLDAIKSLDLDTLVAVTGIDRGEVTRQVEQILFNVAYGYDSLAGIGQGGPSQTIHGKFSAICDGKKIDLFVKIN
jgi:hypothetical protein